MTDKLSSIY